jgi:hypothetical protein
MIVDRPIYSCVARVLIAICNTQCISKLVLMFCRYNAMELPGEKNPDEESLKPKA